MNKLVDYILDGEADKLRDRSSDDEEVQELINGVPKFEVDLTLFFHTVSEMSIILYPFYNLVTNTIAISGL